MCGLVSKIKFGILHDFLKSIDFACLVETKTNFVSADDFPNFEVFTVEPSKKQRFHGIHGICVLVRKKYSDYVSIVKGGECSNILWLNIGEQVLGTTTMLGTCYFPHEGSVHFEDELYDEVIQDMINLSTEADPSFILLGDFNARTGTLQDILDQEDPFISHEPVKDSLESLNIETRRFNTDLKTNNNGRKLINFCKMSNLVIANGRFGQDKGVGALTCTTATGSSTVDYILASPDLLPQVTNLTVDDLDRGLSDAHSPVTIELKPHTQTHVTHETESVYSQSIGKKPSDLSVKSCWKPEHRISYAQHFNYNQVKELEALLDDDKVENLNQDSLNILSSKLTSTLIDPALSCKACKRTTVPLRSKPSRVNQRKYPKCEWFTESCETLRKQYFEIKNATKKELDTQRKKIPPS